MTTALPTAGAGPTDEDCVETMTDVSGRPGAAATAWQDERRRMIVRIPYGLMLDLMAGRLRCANLPQGAVLRYIDTDYTRACWILIIEHPSFAITYEGEMLPVFDAAFVKSRRW